MPSKKTRSVASPHRPTPRNGTPPRVPGVDVRPDAALDPQIVVSFVSLAVCHGDGQIHCGLTVVPPGGAAQTLAATDHIPVQADWLQNQQHQGPVVGPAREVVVTSTDLAEDPRWRDFGRLCVAALDIRSLLAVEVPLHGRGRAVLTFYARRPEALDGIDVDAALKLVPIVSSAVRAALHHHRTALRSASEVDFSRIAVAVAIVMADQRLGAAQAFGRLRDASRQSGRPLLDLALDVLADGHLPGDGTPVAHGRHRYVGGPDMWSETGSAPAA